MALPQIQPVPENPLRLMVISSGNWDNAASAYAVDIAVSLSQRRHQVCFIASPDTPAHRAAVRKKLPQVETIEFKHSRPDRLLHNIRRFRRLCRQLAPQIINVHYSPEHVFANLFSGTEAAIVRTRAGPRAPNSHLGNRLLYNWAAANIACADFIYSNHYRKLRVPEDRKVLIRPGLSVAAFSAGAPDQAGARQQLGLEQAALWVGLVGRYTKAKAHTVLLDAFKLLVERSQLPLRLLLTGIEYDVRIADLEVYAAGLGIRDRIRFMSGKLDDVRTALNALDLLVVPSLFSEGIARIALEGLALGVPTVASNFNSLPEIIGDAGMLIEPGNPAVLADAIERGLTDRTFRERAKVEGPRRVERRYNLDTQIALTEALFNRLAHKRSEPSRG